MLFPGEFCRTSGVYKVVHYQHRMPHHVSVPEAEPFPVCRRCQSKVRYFRLTPEERAAITGPIVEDPDLNGTYITQ
jgi:hypothetical protein